MRNDTSFTPAVTRYALHATTRSRIDWPNSNNQNVPKHINLSTVTQPAIEMVIQ
jgi:hypothetical protein